MVLAWKNAQRFEASTFLLIDSVCAPLPSVSESARHSAITAIRSAMFLFVSEASLAWSACSMLSCALMIPPKAQFGTRLPNNAASARGKPMCRRRAWIISASWMRAAIDFKQPLAIDASVDLRRRERGVTEQFLDRAQVAAA